MTAFLISPVLLSLLSIQVYTAICDDRPTFFCFHFLMSFLSIINDL
jgi:hypothetical protein